MNDFLESECPFCHPEPTRILIKNEHCYSYRDGFPVTNGHTLIIPFRHISSPFDLEKDELEELLDIVRQTRKLLISHHSPQGFNIGVNDGLAAGQTIPHMHIHLIPRYLGDMQDPRGGIRWVIPEKAKYWS